MIPIQVPLSEVECDSAFVMELAIDKTSLSTVITLAVMATVTRTTFSIAFLHLQVTGYLKNRKLIVTAKNGTRSSLVILLLA